MECRPRRSRRGRAHSCDPPGSVCSRSQLSKPWTFLSSFTSFLILSSLIGVIYLMLDYHCNNCSSKCDLNSINKSIEDIAKNLAIMKSSYYDLELKISRFSHELPKIEGQIDILEALATAIESKEAGWNPRSNCTPMPIPNFNMFLNKPPNELRKNVTKCSCPKRTSKLIPVKQD